jgi:hypothetical protein
MAPLHHHYRTKRLERNASRGALLDHHDDAGAVWFIHAEVALMRLRCTGNTIESI